MTKIKAKKIPADDPPAAYELSLGNKATKFNPLPWARACKIAGEAGGNRLRVRGKLYHVFVPPGHGGQGVYGTYLDFDPCPPRAVTNALKMAKDMVEAGNASRSDVTTFAEYTFGGSQHGHHATWRHGGWERDDNGLGRARRARRELIPGGLAPGGRCPRNVLKSELKKGVKVEMEHTRSRRVAREIACDHLTEDRRYYTKLAKIERR
jgi:hypothetical protein